MPTISITKKDLRSLLLTRRRNIPIEEYKAINLGLVTHVKTYLQEVKPTLVRGFWPIANEPDLRQLWQDGAGLCEWALPKVVGERAMEFIPIHSGTVFNKGSFGITEPVGDEVSARIPLSHEDLVLVPSVAIGEKGFRLGYGGGFYDRFLPQHKGLVIAVIFQQFVLEDSLPVEPHDYPLDGYISELGLTLFSERRS